MQVMRENQEESFYTPQEVSELLARNYNCWKNRSKQGIIGVAPNVKIMALKLVLQLLK